MKLLPGSRKRHHDPNRKAKERLSEAKGHIKNLLDLLEKTSKIPYTMMRHPAVTNACAFINTMRHPAVTSACAFINTTTENE